MIAAIRASVPVTLSIVCMGLSTTAWSASEKAKATPAPTASPKETAKPAAKAVRVTMVTSMGTIVLELNPEKAPVTVKNFVDYVESGHYNGTIFHRVIPDFMIQGGGFDAKMNEKSTKAPIKNEGTNGLKNERGTIAMARTSDPDSATAQFFINHRNNDFLNAVPGKAGYAVFGKVVEGMDVVDKIAAVKTGNSGPHSDVPVKPVTLEKATLVK